MKSFSIHQIRAGFSMLIVAVLFVATYMNNQSIVNVPKVESASTDNVTGWAYSEGSQGLGSVTADPSTGPYTTAVGRNPGLGWISFNNTTDGSATAYGVNVDSVTGDFSGRAWIGNATTTEGSTGWISFNRAETGNPPGAPLNGGSGPIAKKVGNNITGWARVLSSCKDNYWNGTACTNVGAGDKAGGWDGWIKLAKDTSDTGAAYGVTVAANGTFSGYAWGSDVVGWIDFAPTVGGVPVQGVKLALPDCTVTACTGGLVCNPISKACITPGGTCSSSADCGGGQSCNGNNTCVYSGQSCLGGQADCVSGEICNANKMCVPSTGGNSCGNSNDCVNGQLCVSGTCSGTIKPKYQQF